MQDIMHKEGEKNNKNPPTLKEPETALKIWEEFLCQSLMEIIRERMSQTIFKN